MYLTHILEKAMYSIQFSIESTLTLDVVCRTNKCKKLKSLVDFFFQTTKEYKYFSRLL